MAAVLFASLAGLAFGALAVAVRIGYARQAEPVLAPLAISLFGTVAVLAVTGASDAFEDAGAGDLWPFAVIGAAVPGASQVLFVRAIRDAGPSRASVAIGTAPLLSAALAVLFLDEPLRPALGVATLLIVGSGMLLGWERTRPVGFRVSGVILGVVCALLFALRDNLVRLVERNHHPSTLAATVVTLAGASAALAIIAVATPRPAGRPRFRSVAVAFLPAGLCLGIAYAALIEAFDRGKVTVVAPLNATQALWAVILSAILLKQTEAIGKRLVLAAVLVVVGGVLVGITR